MRMRGCGRGPAGRGTVPIRGGPDPCWPRPRVHRMLGAVRASIAREGIKKGHRPRVGDRGGSATQKHINASSKAGCSRKNQWQRGFPGLGGSC